MSLAHSFEAGRVPRLSLPQGYVTTKLRSGIPALSGEPIQPPVDAIRPTLVTLCGALAEGGGGEATMQILAAVQDGRLNVPALLTMTLRREQAALRALATRNGLGHDLLWLVADLAVSPFAHVLLNTLFGAIPSGSPLASTLNSWTHGYCPLCGSWPSLVEQINAERRLRCSFCAAAWNLPQSGCLYCGEHGAPFSTLTPDPAAPQRVVETCGTCRGYTKVVESSASLPFPLLALADLESMDLDLAAMQTGCARPASRKFGRH
jgi:FdhE protein